MITVSKNLKKLPKNANKILPNVLKRRQIWL